MNMKKILFAGIAVGALASTGASAAVIQSARVSGINLTPGATQILVAQEATFNAARFTALDTAVGAFFDGTSVAKSANQFSVIINPLSAVSIFTPTSGAGNTRNFKVSFKLDGTGDPRFVNAVSAANLAPIYAGTPALSTACTVSAFTISAGGVANSNFVDALFTVTDALGGGCTGGATGNAPIGVSLSAASAQTKLNAVGNATLTATFTNPGDGSIFDTAAGTVPLVTTVPVYDVAVAGQGIGPVAPTFGTLAITPTVFSAATTPAYTAILAAVPGSYDVIIGAVKATYLPAATYSNASVGLPVGTSGTQSTVASLFTGLNGSLLAAALIAPSITFTNTAGDYTALNPAVAGTVLTVNPNNKSIATATTAASAVGLAAVNITATTVAGNVTSVSLPQTQTATVQAIQATGILNNSGTPSSNLETIGQQGTIINAPWFGGSKAASNSVVRLSSSVGTGAVTATLLNPVRAAGDTGSNASCPVVTSIAAGGEVVFDTARATTCFGDFIRGDVRFVINGSQVGLTAKMRVVSSGTVSELTLGNISQGAFTSQ